MNLKTYKNKLARRETTPPPTKKKKQKKTAIALSAHILLKDFGN